MPQPPLPSPNRLNKLNRAAVALAADSATTVTYWEGGQRRVRFFKGANKIFNISDQHPVGMMIYDAGSLEGMPWEVISKAYRTARGHVPRSKLGEYADDLFDFIQSEGHIFPGNIKKISLYLELSIHSCGFPT